MPRRVKVSWRINGRQTALAGVRPDEQGPTNRGTAVPSYPPPSSGRRRADGIPAEGIREIWRTRTTGKKVGTIKSEKNPCLAQCCGHGGPAQNFGNIDRVLQVMELAGMAPPAAHSSRQAEFVILLYTHRQTHPSVPSRKHKKTLISFVWA